MDKETIAALLALNRQFYTDWAEPFAASRSTDDPALTPILPHIPQGARVLDVGCGDGRLARLLHREGFGGRYVGVDWVPALLERADRGLVQCAGLAASVHLADITRPGWTSALPAGAFDCAVALAVLHHIPSFDLRAQVLRDIGAVLRPAGQLILSTWQFLAHARLRRKIVPWSEAGIPEEKVEPGDYLLRWQRGGHGLRYCHLLDETELPRLVAAGGLRVLEAFRAGGREGDLGLFAVAARALTTPQAEETGQYLGG